MLKLLSILISLAAPALAADHVKVSVTTDPQIASPGGWVDLVFSYEVEPGWFAVSPRSAKSDAAAKLEFALPEGLRTAGQVWAPVQKPATDAKLGEIEKLVGKGEVRQRLHVGGELGAVKLSVKGATSWVVSDSSNALAPQKLDFSVDVPIAPNAGRGPLLRNFDPNFELSAQEQALLASNHFVVHLRPETQRARGGDDVCILLDTVIADGYVEDFVQIACEPLDGCFVPLDGWRAFAGTLTAQGGKTSKAFREVLPLRFVVGGKGGELSVPITITIRTRKTGAPSTSQATQESTITLEYAP